jgi:hypothetical protein
MVSEKEKAARMSGLRIAQMRNALAIRGLCPEMEGALQELQSCERDHILQVSQKVINLAAEIQELVGVNQRLEFQVGSLTYAPLPAEVSPTNGKGSGAEGSSEILLPPTPLEIRPG